jgi:hypothetical protein
LTWTFSFSKKNPLAEKRTKKAMKANGEHKKKQRGIYLPPSFSGYLPDARRFYFHFYSAAPLVGRGC